MQLSVCILIIDCLSKTFLYQPGHPWLPIVVISLNGVASAGVSLMALAMLGDIADFDEWQTGLRQEGLFSALLSWFEKAGNSLGSFLTGFLLIFIGFNAKLGPQSAHTLALMKISYIVTPIIGALIALLFIHRYELSESRVYEIKEELALRRGALSALPSLD